LCAERRGKRRRRKAKSKYKDDQRKGERERERERAIGQYIECVLFKGATSNLSKWGKRERSTKTAQHDQPRGGNKAARKRRSNDFDDFDDEENNMLLLLTSHPFLSIYYFVLSTLILPKPKTP